MIVSLYHINFIQIEMWTIIKNMKGLLTKIVQKHRLYE